jgi:hypothetical protein
MIEKTIDMADKKASVAMRSMWFIVLLILLLLLIILFYVLGSNLIKDIIAG